MEQNEQMPPEFNLLDEPWIVVLTKDGMTKEVGIIELFRHAHEYVRLAGETTTQDTAILRMLLAILHRVFGLYTVDGEYDCVYGEDVDLTKVLDRWQQVWDCGSLRQDVLMNYLEHYRERFWLFHPTRPFYQVAGLGEDGAQASPTKYSSRKLIGEIAESGNKVRLFSSRNGSKKNVLTDAEAARWLIHVIGFDDNAAKKGGPGWLGQLGVIIACGQNLFETLMFNFVMVQKPDGTPWKYVKLAATWEPEEAKRGERIDIGHPQDPAALLTLQSRRIELYHKNRNDDRYELLGGDFFDKENAFCEPMTLWRRNKELAFVPRTHDSSAQMWRNLSSLLTRGDNVAGVVAWVDRLRRSERIDKTKIQFQTMGILYGGGVQKSNIEDHINDQLTLSPLLLSERYVDWSGRIVETVEITEKLVNQLGIFAENIAKVLVGDGKNNKNQKKIIESRVNRSCEDAYYALDLPFREWLEQIDPEQDEIDDVCDRWWQRSQKIVRDFGKELVQQSGRNAFMERKIEKEENSKKIPPIPKSYNQFIIKTSSIEALKGGG
jgi:CRISPR system Cascade subunit CasA